jgi:hypothetical protein
MCTQLYIYTYIYIYILILIYIYIWLYIYTNTHTYIYIYSYTIYIYMYSFTIYICICVCIHFHMHTCIYLQYLHYIYNIYYILLTIWPENFSLPCGMTPASFRGWGKVEALREKNADIINGQKQLTGEATQRGKKTPLEHGDSTWFNQEEWGFLWDLMGSNADLW